MATITLSYDARNTLAKKTLEDILSLGVFSKVEKNGETNKSKSVDEFLEIEEDSEFAENKQKLQARADKIDNGSAEYSSFEELDALLEKTISKHEN